MVLGLGNLFGQTQHQNRTLLLFNFRVRTAIRHVPPSAGRSNHDTLPETMSPVDGCFPASSESTSTHDPWKLDGRYDLLVGIPASRLMYS